MDRASVNWTGAMPALTTPFEADGKIDFDGYAANIERLLAAGATGLSLQDVPASSGRSATPNAQISPVRRWARLQGAAPSSSAPGRSLADEVIAQSRTAADAGADAILVMPPYFIHATPDEIFFHVEAVNRGTALPLVLYNIPGNAGNPLMPDLAKRLADLDKVVAIKESSGDWGNFHRTLIAVGDRIRVFCGPSSVFGTAAIAAGADGLIDCFPNVWTGCLDLWSAAKAGDGERSSELQATGLALTDLFVSGGRTLYPATKAAMNYLGLPGGGLPRPPLRPLSGAPLKNLQRGLDDILKDMKATKPGA